MFVPCFPNWCQHVLSHAAAEVSSWAFPTWTRLSSIRPGFQRPRRCHVCTWTPYESGWWWMMWIYIITKEIQQQRMIRSAAVFLHLRHFGSTSLSNHRKAGWISICSARALSRSWVLKKRGWKWLTPVLLQMGHARRPNCFLIVWAFLSRNKNKQSKLWEHGLGNSVWVRRHKNIGIILLWDMSACLNSRKSLMSLYQVPTIPEA